MLLKIMTHICFTFQFFKGKFTHWSKLKCETFIQKTALCFYFIHY